MATMIKNMKSAGRKLLNMKKIPDAGKAFLYDYYKWLKYSLSINADNSSGKQKAILLMNLHALEKGLSFKKAKSGFGREKVLLLLKQTDNHLKNNGIDSLGLAALGVLQQYIHHPQSYKEEYIVKQFHVLLDKYEVCADALIGGVKPVNKESVSSDLTYAQLYHFASVRHSVRNFSDEEVTEEQVLRAVKFAQTAPSVCNRQTARVHVFSKDSFEPIVNAQLGDQGWVKNANKLFIITTDLNYFGSTYERNQAYIEGGLFSMQFVMGLHAQGIASCCKMYIRSPLNDKNIYKATGIKENEVPIMLILAGHYESETIKVPYSFRFPVQDIVKFH
jgi:nitroreductase